MRKTYQFLVAFVVSLLCSATATAGERVALTADMFYSYDGWGVNAVQGAQFSGAQYLIEEPASTVFGDPNCNAGIDLAAYSKLYITARAADEGRFPRIFINRTADNGQFNADKSASACLVIPNAGTWAEDYYTVDGDEYVIDLKKIAKDWGFVRIHSIKGPSWDTNAILTSIEAEKAEGGQKVGWVNLINNSDMEGDDVSSFFTKVSQGAPEPSVITDGVGYEESRGIKVEATAKVADAWDNQFWFRFNETVPAGTKYRVSFNYRADAAAKVSTQAHAEPSDYIHYVMLGEVEFTENWQTFSSEGEVTAEQAGPNSGGGLFTSVAFNLNELADANNYYFDNIKFEIYKLGTALEFSNEAIKVDFGFETNIPELVKNGGRPRLVYPNDCVAVTANGQEISVFSVEAYADGRFYIFTEDALEDNAEIVVTFKNPTDAAYRVVYAAGPSEGSAVTDFTETATYNSEMEYEYDDVYPYDLETPIVIAADPEDGSFNLPNSIKEFKLTFDKKVDAGALKATLNGKALSVVPSEGFAEEITLVREGDDLPTGVYTINVTKIYPTFRIDESVYGDTTYTVGIGKAQYDPNDVVKVLMKDNFTDTADGFIPEGWTLVFNGNPRDHGVNVGSGPRNFLFADGGDFKGALYYRTDNANDDSYAMYGAEEGYSLSLEAEKSYNIHYANLSWKGTPYTLFEILNANDEVVYSRVDATAPNMNGDKSKAITGANLVEFKFTPEATGDYRLKWTPASNAQGDKGAGMVENLLGNVEVKYMPNTPGIEYIQLLGTALENAKNAQTENAGERYASDAYNKLVAAIEKYEAEQDGYTSPTAFKNAASDLDALSSAVKTHRQNCDSYDDQIKKAIDVVRKNAENKFANTNLYNQLKNIVAKYNGSSEWVAEDPENPESAVLQYTYDVLTDDAALTTAIDELKTIANTADLLFTEGASAPENANGGKGTGVAVLVERIRLGALTLKALGVADDDPLVVEANNALTDDGALANKIKSRITEILYGELKNADNTLFQESVNEETGDVITPSYDMTVFVKNPNIYKLADDMNFNAENVPGWTTPEGYSAPGLTVGWGQAKGNKEIAEDCMFQTWGGSYRVEQTVEYLPAGVYTLSAAFGERMSDTDMSETYFYAKTSADEEIPVFAGEIGQAFPFVGGLGNLSIEGVVVTDGILTLGVNAGNGSHTFFNEVRVYLTAPAAGFDYAAAYETAGIETLEGTPAAKVRAIQLFDVNGRRLSKAQKGITIMKKVMSDGSIKTEKVIVK